MRQLLDGTVLSGATKTSRGGDSRREAALPTTGIVYAYHAADDSTNLLRLPCVDLILPRTGTLCHGAVLPWGGAARNGEAWVPSPCSVASNGVPFDLSMWDTYDPDTLDGDRVAVAFLDGDPGRPYVLGPMPSRTATWHPGITDGCERVIRHQGTEIRLDGSGGVTIDATGAGIGNDGLPVPGTLPASITIKASALANVEINGQAVKIGSGATEPTIKASTFYSWLIALVALIRAHEHPISGGVAVQSATLQTATDPPAGAQSTKAMVE